MTRIVVPAREGRAFRAAPGQAVNLFENNPIGADGTLGIEPAPSRAGDSVTFRAELDCIVCVTACPQDLTPLCGWTPTSIVVEINHLAFATRP